MGDFSEWKKQATPDETSVQVCFDRGLYRQFADASAQLEGAREAGMLAQPDDVTQLMERVVDLKRRVEQDQADHTFVFATIPYSRWQGLLDEHSPTDDQKAENRYIEFDPTTFPQAAVAASCSDPPLTDDDAAWLREHLPRSEFERLFAAALQVNVGGSSIPKSVAGIVDRLASELSSITQPAEESPSPSSVDGR